MSHRVVSSVLVLGGVFAAFPAAAADPTKEQCIAANDHAQEFRQAGKLSKAREQLVLCVAQSCPGPVREDCAQRLDEVDKAMPTIVFVVKDASGNDVSGVSVTMDGQPLAAKLTGAAVAVDPGSITSHSRRQACRRLTRLLSSARPRRIAASASYSVRRPGLQSPGRRQDPRLRRMAARSA